MLGVRGIEPESKRTCHRHGQQGGDCRGGSQVGAEEGIKQINDDGKNTIKKKEKEYFKILRIITSPDGYRTQHRAVVSKTVV